MIAWTCNKTRNMIGQHYSEKLGFLTLYRGFASYEETKDLT